MKDAFLNIKEHNQLAQYFGVTYDDLSKILYRTGDIYKYHKFKIPKKNGKFRNIASPSKKLKNIQLILKDVLYEIYHAKPSTHGFAKGKSIVTNAERHLDKKFVFNIDISDFFGSIHFGRVRNLFMSSPFNFNHTVSTILAQICCFKNSIPQGAPTSPIISNMIAFKLDSQLQRLAKLTNSTYTRYADDISFSFTCSQNRLPQEIVITSDIVPSQGNKLINIIKDNGFSINYDKVRLSSTLSSMEVTGLKVNKFVNVKRQYIRQISSMLYACKKHGNKNAEVEYNDKYNKKHRASGKPVSFIHVLKGKLAFLKSVRSGHDLIFNKLAKRFNELIDKEQLDQKYKFNIYELTDPEQNAIDSLWVIQACYNNEKNEVITTEGSGFQLKGIGIVTCAHVVASKNKKIFKNIEVFKHTDISKKYILNVNRICHDRDVAICSIDNTDSITEVDMSSQEVNVQDDVKLLGFPSYTLGQSHFIVDTKITTLYPLHGVGKFEIDNQIRTGNSGGPIIDDQGKVVGIAQKGVTGQTGNNECIKISEINEVINNDQYKI